MFLLQYFDHFSETSLDNGNLRKWKSSQIRSNRLKTFFPPAPEVAVSEKTSVQAGFRHHTQGLQSKSCLVVLLVLFSPVLCISELFFSSGLA